MAEELPKAGKKNSKKLAIKTDTLVRETSSHYIRLIGDADRKARIMVVVNSILLTIAATAFTRTFDMIAFTWVSLVLLIGFALVSLFFSVISIKPELQNHIASQTEDNLLHYKKCSELSLREYARLMTETLTNDDKKRDAIIKELYYYGNLLTMKYKLIKQAYRFFFLGVTTGIVSYLIILLLNKTGVISPV